MGYPIAYRTSAARAARQLSRPTPTYVRPARKNPSLRARTPVAKYTPPVKNIPANLPPLGLPEIPARQALKIAIQLLRLHPYFRAFMLGYTLFEAFDWLMRHPNPAIGTNWVPCGGPTPSPIRLTHNGWAAGSLFCTHGYDTAVNTQVPPRPIPYQYLQEHMRGWRPPIPSGQNLGWHLTTWRNLNHPVLEAKPPIPYIVPQAWPDPLPLWRYPLFDPIGLPIGQPVGTPQPIPYELIPNRPLDPNTERGYSPPKSFVDTFAPTQTSPLTSSGPSLGRARPPRNQKEKKFKANGVIGGIARALKTGAFIDGKLKDLRDLVGALHDSLPKHLQLKGKEKKQLQKVLRRVYDNLDQLDAKEALLGILKEIGEDLLGGFGDKLRSEAATKNGWFKNKIFTSPRF